MSSEIDKRALAYKTIGNSLAGLIGFVWPIVLSLASMPYIVHKLGNELFGVFSIVMSLLGFFAFLDMGTTTAAVKYIAESYAKKDVCEINRIISSLFTVYLIIGVVGGALIVLAANPLSRVLFKIPDTHITDAIYAFYVAAIGFAINMLLGVFVAIPKALQRFDLVTRINIAISTILTIATLLLLFLGYGFRHIVILNLVTSLCSLSVFLLISKKIIPEIRIDLSFDVKIMKKLLSFGIFSMIAALSGNVLFHLDKLVIGIFLGTASVTFYVIPATISIKIHTLVSHLMGVVLPLSSELSATGNRTVLRDVFLLASKYSTIVSLSLTVPVAVVSYEIMKYWMGQDYASNSSVPLSILIIACLFATTTVVPSYIIEGLGKPRINAMFAVASAVTNIALCLLLIPSYGIVGAALANLINVVLIVPYIWVTHRYILGEMLNTNTLKVIYLKPLIAAFLQGVIVYVLLKALVFGLITLVFVLVAACCVYYLLALVIKAIDKTDIITFVDYLRLKLQTKKIY